MGIIANAKSKVVDYVRSKVGVTKIYRRNFTAGKVDNLTASWTITALTSDETLRRYLRVLRARSREQSENNDYAKRFISLSKTNIVGPKGIIFQARTVRTDTGELDKRANQVLETQWKDFIKYGNCEMSGQMSFTGLLNLFIATVLVDGECIIRLIRSKIAGEHYFSLTFIDAELLDVEYNEVLTGGRYIRMGIEFSKYHRPVAYHFIDQDEQTDSYSYRGKKYMRIPASDILHRFIIERVGQKRGVPWMSTALFRMQMLGGFEEASLTNARTGASKMGFYITPTGNEFVGDDVDSDGNIVSEATPGSFEQLPHGYDFKAFDPAYPNGEFKDFMKTCLRGISSGLGVSYNTLANDLEGVNFSSMRSGVLEDREAWKCLQNWVIESVCQPIYEEWLRQQLVIGSLKIGKGSLRPDLEIKYRNVEWRPRRWAWVDPAKDIKSHKDAIEMKSESVSSVIRERGGDPEEVFNEIASERELLEELGLSDLIQLDTQQEGDINENQG